MPIHRALGHAAPFANFKADSMTNVTASILSKLDASLLHLPNHPLRLVKERIFQFFAASRTDISSPSPLPSKFVCIDRLDPIVTVKKNFDELGFPADHVGRSQHDSYFFNRHLMLRTHMTANEREVLQAGHRAFLLAGDVYRRDEIDRTHYPVFHQVEGVRVFDEATIYDELQPVDQNPLFPDESVPKLIKSLVEQESQPAHASIYQEASARVLGDLVGRTSELLRHLFGANIPIRWQACYFPFTQPSLEAEVYFRGDWLEVLGCGILQHEFLRESLPTSSPTGLNMAWAFGLGLERIAMILYDIPDIRLFWSQDPRFLQQFKADTEVRPFQPFSKYPHMNRDMSFWLPVEGFDANGLYEIVREIAGDLVETVKLVDIFEEATTGRQSQCYRITYRSMERSLTDEEVNKLQERIRGEATQRLGVKLR